MFRTLLDIRKTHYKNHYFTPSMIKKTGTLLTIYEIKKYKNAILFLMKNEIYQIVPLLKYNMKLYVLILSYLLQLSFSQHERKKHLPFSIASWQSNLTSNILKLTPTITK
jgi:hypothetical protein